ncbi:MAG: histidine--tRNA ligase [Thermoprotei archaeon]|nr:MAG: histidine--tRNA ligase [Thermoprotei archaeon]
MFQPPRGTRDWLPEENIKRRVVSERIREVFERYGYGEVVTPAFEHLDLLVAKAGEEVKQQIYWFKDKAGRSLGLRFELTTPIARIVASRLDMPRPTRFYYIQPVWRYEEPQKGRYREFWQAGIELIGVSGPEGDAEVIAVTYRSIRHAGLERFSIHVSDRRIVEEIVLQSGISAERLDDALRVLDKLDKRGKDYVIEELVKMGANESSVEEMLSTLEEGSLDLDLKSDRGKEGLNHLSRTVELLNDSYSIKVKVDYSIVRGLAYYTGLVFEVKTGVTGEMGSIAGGGRYDDLVSIVGGPHIPATGMSIGLERLIESLLIEGKLKEFTYRNDVVVIPVKYSWDILKKCIEIAEKIRAGGLSTIVDYSVRSLTKSLEKASKRGFRFAVIIGPKELKENQVTLRDLENWKEYKVSIDNILDAIKRGKT